MLAKPNDGIPTGDWRFEPKWDGFRCIVFRDGDEIELGSRNQKPLTRYFPEMIEPLRAALPDRCVVDGERERIKRLSGAETSVNYVATVAYFMSA